MTKKIPIDDAMVERAVEAYSAGSEGSDYFMRCALEAALNPPEEPEIVVTEEMKEEGRKQVRYLAQYNLAAQKSGVFLEGGSGSIEPSDSEIIYRAMRRLEPKRETAADAVQHSVTERCHRRAGMREKMARAIYENLQSRSFSMIHPWETREGAYRETFVVAADAALDVLMEPTEGMVNAALEPAAVATCRPGIHVKCEKGCWFGGRSPCVAPCVLHEAVNGTKPFWNGHPEDS